MKVLVTGGAGYVGSILSRRLLAAGHEVRVFDSLAQGGTSLAGLYLEEGFSFMRGDLRDSGAVRRAVEGMHAVVHLAAIVGDPACAREPELAQEVNHEGSIHLFEAARSNGVGRFVFASTCSNYGRLADPNHPVDETAELLPLSLYARSKVAVEQYLLNQPTDSPMTTTVLRFATVYGVSPRMRFDLTVNEFTRDLVLDGKLTIFGEQFWRPYVHVRDAARAVETVLASPVSLVDRAVFNVGDSRENFTKGMLVKKIERAIDGPTELLRVRREDDPRDYRVDFTRISRVLNFQITRTVDDGIREVIDALRQGVFPDPRHEQYRNERST